MHTGYFSPLCVQGHSGIIQCFFDFRQDYLVTSATYTGYLTSYMALTYELTCSYLASDHMDQTKSSRPLDLFVFYLCNSVVHVYFQYLDGNLLYLEFLIENWECQLICLCCRAVVKQVDEVNTSYCHIVSSYPNHVVGLLSNYNFVLLFVQSICIGQGMYYLHQSVFLSHGHLTSSNCLVDCHWVCKISDYGLGLFKYGSRSEHRENAGKSQLGQVFNTFGRVNRLPVVDCTCNLKSTSHV